MSLKSNSKNNSIDKSIRKSINNSYMVDLDDLDDILMEDLDEIIEREEFQIRQQEIRAEVKQDTGAAGRLVESPPEQPEETAGNRSKEASLRRRAAGFDRKENRYFEESIVFEDDAASEESIAFGESTAPEKNVTFEKNLKPEETGNSRETGTQEIAGMSGKTAGEAGFVGKSEGPEKPGTPEGSAGKSEGPEKPEKPGTPEGPEKSEEPEKPGTPEDPERSDETEKSGASAEPGTLVEDERPIKGMVDPEPEPAQQEPVPEKKKTSPWKVIGIIFLVLFLLALIAAGCAYGYGVKYYESHFLPGTVAEGVRLDNLTLEEADAKLTNEKIVEDTEMQLITMEGDSVTLDITPMKIRRHYLGLSEALEAQDKWRFFLTVEETKPLPAMEYEIAYDEAGALEALQKLEICDPEKTEPPMDSYVYQDEKTKEWKVMEAADGNTLDPEIVADAVVKAVDERTSEVDIASTGAYLKAQIREDDETLNRRAKLENAVDAQSFAIDMSADTVRDITAAEFRSLLKEGIFDDVYSVDELAESVLDEEKFSRFMDSIARSYSTKSESGYRYFKSVTGAKIAMQTYYGWDMNEEATSDLVRAMLEDAGSKIFVDENLQERYPDHTVAAVWDQTAVSHGERDTGESWVEVNLTQQKMYCIIDGETVLESDVVSGTETSKGRRTPAGFFSLKFKSTERDLVGYNPDGTESYRSHVHYWMPVYNNIGLHDATWRYAFGGTHFLYNGSHGCVNLPLKAAKQLYGYVYKEMPVIFYRENKS